MSEIPSEQEQLIQQIKDPVGGTHGREATRARLDALLVRDLAASLARLSTGMEQATRVVGESLAEVAGELVRTRKQMADSSVAASRHQRALVVWTAVLSFATIAYAVGSFLPFFWRSFAASGSVEPAWVLWLTQGNAQPRIYASYKSMEGCVKEIDHRENSARANPKESAYRGAPTSLLLSGQEWVCVPDTVDPRGPKGK